MVHSKGGTKETVASAGIEAILQFEKSRTGVCHACDQQVREGSRVAAYARRPSRHDPWLLTQVCCPAHPPRLDALATLGVDERILTGRIGRCTDQARQRSWPVLLSPTVHESSSPRTNKAVTVPTPHPLACPDAALPLTRTHQCTRSREGQR